MLGPRMIVDQHFVLISLWEKCVFIHFDEQCKKTTTYMALILALPLCPLSLWTVCPLQMFIKWIVESESKGINYLFCIKLTSHASVVYLEFFFLGFTIANNLLTVNLILCIIFLSHLWTSSAPSLHLWIFSLVFLQVSFLAILTSASSLHPPNPSAYVQTAHSIWPFLLYLQ